MCAFVLQHITVRDMSAVALCEKQGVESVVHVSLRGGLQHAILKEKRFENGLQNTSQPQHNVDGIVKNELQNTIRVALASQTKDKQPCAIYVATFNFFNLAKAYLEQIWPERDVSWRIFAREFLINGDSSRCNSNSTSCVCPNSDSSSSRCSSTRGMQKCVKPISRNDSLAAPAKRAALAISNPLPSSHLPPPPPPITSLLPSNPISSSSTITASFEPSKATMIEAIARSSARKIDSKEQILFFDDTLDNVTIAKSVANAHHVDNAAGFTRDYLAAWLSKQGAPSTTQCMNAASNSNVQDDVNASRDQLRDIVDRFVDFCRQNDIRILIFDLDQTLLRIHSFYAGISADAIRNGAHDATRDFADFELVQMLAQRFE